MNKIESIIDYMPAELDKVFKNIDRYELSVINEIRVRRDKPIVLVIKNTAYFLDKNNKLVDFCDSSCLIVNSKVFDELFLRLCDYSIHSNIETLKKGFLTLNNGARVGVASTAVLDEHGYSFVKNIVSLNIRVPQEMIGCSNVLVNSIFKDDLPSIIVAGRPNSGKTTLLRDLAFQLSNGANGKYHKVSIIDERNEFCAKQEKNFTMNLGLNSDVLTYFSKPIGIEIATRALSPELIICDEISTDTELSSILYGFSSGVSFALSVHISDVEDLFNKPIISKLLFTKQFSYIILLDNYTYIPKIINANEVLSEISRNDNANDMHNFIRYN